jgi:hypothetical protein
MVPAARLREDVALLRRVLTELHPGLHRYADAATVARRFDDLAADLRSDAPLDRVYLRLSRFLATIRCGHSYANFWNQPDAVKPAVFGRPDKVPFTFRLVGRRMIVTGDFTPEGAIGATAEVLAIGGRRVDDLLAELVTLVKADGGNDAKRLHDLQLSGEGRFEAFDVYQPLVLPPVGGRYALDLAELRTGRARSVGVAAVSREERARRIAERRGRPAPTPDEMWSLRFLDDGAAHLVLGSFVTWQMKLDWKAFLAEAFGAMRARGNPGLVLDVRGNEGGSDEVLLELARYLVWKPVELPARRSLVRYRRLPPDLGAHLDTWDESFRDFGEDAAPRGDGFFELRSASRAGRRLEPGPDAYRGRIVLLVDAANSSATFTLASLLKDGGLATLVGQPTGGSRRGLNGGKIFFLRLPGSGIEVDVPVVGTFPVEEQPDEGVRPDVLVEPSVEDVLAGRDAALAAAQASLASPPPGKLVDLVCPIVGAGHVVARVDAPLDGWGTWGAGGVREGAVEQPGRGDVFGGWARLRVREGQVVLVRAGTSFTSGEAAERNLDAEIGEAGFDEVRSRTEAAWEEALSRVRVRGGAPEQRQVF